MLNRAKFVVVLIAVCAATIISSPTKLAAQDWARKMFKEVNHDFGTVVRGADSVYRFEVENIYLEEIEIESVGSSCKCTSATIEKHKLKTWEKTSIVARFDTLGFSGFRQATLTVKFARPFVGEVQLHVRGIIRTDLQVAPGSINFGTVSPTSGNKQSVDVRRFGNAKWRIIDVQSSFPHVGVTLQETQRDFNRVNYRLTASLKSTAPPGMVQGELIVIAQDGNQEIKVPIQFSGKVIPALQVSPAVLDLTNVKPGEVVTKKIILKADKAFSVTDVTCENSAFSVKAEDGSKNVHVIAVTYTGEATAGRYEASLRFVTDLPEQTTATLPAIVTVVDDESHN
jgi:hypothetical protein